MISNGVYSVCHQNVINVVTVPYDSHMVYRNVNNVL